MPLKNHLLQKIVVAIILLSFICFISNPLYSQNTLDIFILDENLRTTINLEEDLQDFSILRLNDVKASYESFRIQNAAFRLKLPIDANNSIEIELTEHDFYADNFSLIEKTATGDKLLEFEKPLHYLGRVVGQNTSSVGVTLSKDQLYGVISYGGNNYNIEFNSRNNEGDYYLLYKQEDYKHPLNFQCDAATNESELPDLGGIKSSGNVSVSRSAGPVNIYIECDYQMFLTNGNINATSTYAANLFNMVAGIYRASTNPVSGPRGANTTLKLSQLAVWTTPDSYDAANLNNLEELLSLFRCQESGQNYNGRLAHILTTARLGGGLADMPICPTSSTYSSPVYGVSEVINTFNSNLSIYSVDIYVLAHELGHQLSSPHTHECAWNGNNTPIDCCGNNAGLPACACSAGVPNKGTIMSYCHLDFIDNSPTGNPGIDLSQGFHPQVAAKIENFATNCLSPTVAPPLCAAPTDNEINFSAITNTSVTVNCTKTGDFYAFEYLDVATGIVTCVNCANASSSGIYTISGLSPCKSYKVSVSIFCNGDWSRSTLFGCDDFSFMTTGTGCAIDGECRTSIIVRDSDVPGATGIFKAATTIKTSGNIAVNSGETVRFYAGNSVTLQPGFHAKGGSSFTADIQNCTPALQEEEIFNKASVKTNEEVSNSKISINQYTPLTNFSDIKLTIQPNPFTNLTTLYFNLAEKEEINLLVFNINGQLMDDIILKQIMDKGFHTVNYDANKLEEGIFHLVLKTNKAIHTKKMVVIK